MLNSIILFQIDEKWLPQLDILKFEENITCLKVSFCNGFLKYQQFFGVVKGRYFSDPGEPRDSFSLFRKESALQASIV